MFNASLPPDPPDDHGDRGARFDPRPLSSVELKDLRHSLSEALQRDLQRITAYRGGDLSVHVNGKAYGPLPREGDAYAPCTIPLAASYVEIYGRDNAGALLLAVFPLPEPDSVTDNHERHLVVRHEGGPTIELAIQPVPADTGEIREFLLGITYEEAQQPAVSREAVSLDARVAQGIQHTSEQAMEAIASAVQRVVRWISMPWLVPLADKPATAADIPPQEHVFYLDDGEIRVICEWRAAYQNYPATVRLRWQADLTRPGDLWIRFTQRDNPMAEITKILLGRRTEGDETFTASQLDGFDPTQTPWALTLFLTEPQG